MCEAIVTEIARRGGPSMTAGELFNASPTGELSHIWEAYLALFPERLPAEVSNPYVGALRYQSNAIEAWDGSTWRRL